MYKMVSFPALELFEKVWSTPVLKLAREIGVSDVALGKACRKAGIAVPRRGHWAKPATKRPKKPAPPISNELVSFRVLDRTLFPEKLASVTDEIPLPPKVTIPDSLVDPHPLVDRWRKTAQKAKAIEGRLALQQDNVLNTRISPALIDRAAILLDTLIKHTETNGCRWAVSKQQTTVTFDGETVYVTLRERLLKQELPPPPPDPKPKKVWTLDLSRMGMPRYEFLSTGELTLILRESPDYGLQKTFSDAKTGRIEDKIHLFIPGLEALTQRIKVSREEWEEKRRRDEEEELIRKADAVKSEQQRRLRKRLVRNLEHWEKAKRLRSFVDAVVRDCQAEADQVEAWAEWARQQAALLDPSTSPATISLDCQIESYFTGYRIAKDEDDWWER
ncbi:hypothetical protein H4C80_15470 [Pseudomonas juntendi]|uniref:Uncharacterized protein n=1 Tax=Pseudomonas juntendi TaxID=2666183 RepID=A0A7W2Q9T4_9PSED|nr:hypothetical protein [Pseudomonas juntendi]MBA6098519.1 hypothetical protein [Pseudomonas juntendi]